MARAPDANVGHLGLDRIVLQVHKAQGWVGAQDLESNVVYLLAPVKAEVRVCESGGRVLAVRLDIQLILHSSIQADNHVAKAERKSARQGRGFQSAPSHNRSKRSDLVSSSSRLRDHRMFGGPC